MWFPSILSPTIQARILRPTMATSNLITMAIVLISMNLVLIKKPSVILNGAGEFRDQAAHPNGDWFGNDPFVQ